MSLTSNIFKCLACGKLTEVIGYQEPHACPSCKGAEDQISWELMHSREIPSPRSEPSATVGIDLLPCPFCGGVATFADAPIGSGTDWTIGCSDPDCTMHVVAGPFPTPDEVAEVWNRRSQHADA